MKKTLTLSVAALSAIGLAMFGTGCCTHRESNSLRALTVSSDAGNYEEKGADLKVWTDADGDHSRRENWDDVIHTADKVHTPPAGCQQYPPAVLQNNLEALPQSNANPGLDDTNEPIPDASIGCPKHSSPDSTMCAPAQVQVPVETAPYVQVPPPVVQPAAVVVQPYAYVQTCPSCYYVKSYVRVPFLGVGFSFGRGHWVGGSYQGRDPYGRSYGGWSQPGYYRSGGSSYYGSGGNWYYRPGPVASSWGSSGWRGGYGGGSYAYAGSRGGNAYASASSGGGYYGGGHGGGGRGR